jgi:hypothetical protein
MLRILITLLFFVVYFWFDVLENALVVLVAMAMTIPFDFILINTDPGV